MFGECSGWDAVLAVAVIATVANGIMVHWWSRERRLAFHHHAEASTERLESEKTLHSAWKMLRARRVMISEVKLLEDDIKSKLTKEKN